MKIGFDVSQTGKLKAGCGYFADTLIRNLAEIDRENEYFLYPTFGDVYWDPDWRSGTCQINRPNFQLFPINNSLSEGKSFWSRRSAEVEEKIGKPDLIHANNFFCPKELHNARLVYTLYDLSFLVHPEWTTEENRTGCFDGVFNASLYADLIVSISHFSRKHFLEVFPHYPADRVVVVYPGSRFAKPQEIPRPQSVAQLSPHNFWLNVGVLEPRKNHLGLLKAYALLKQEMGKTFPLVLAGGKGWMIDDFQKQLTFFNLRDDVIILGYVDDITLQWLYQNCFAFVYPSFFEGFGLPVLEAMTVGAPVITSNVSSIPEIVGDAGILIDPSREEDLFLAMRKMMNQFELRHKLKEMGILRSHNFSWKSAAAKVLREYYEISTKDRISLKVTNRESH
jgi:glycosyltransferase involved in cell wall biosynthesis